MNPFFLIFIGLPALEIFLFIKIGGEIGALNTLLLIFLSAFIGVYFAKLQGMKTMRSGVINLYQNKTPIYEILAGASIAIAAFLLILPGFFTDIIGFLILIPISRKILINFFVRKNKINPEKNNNILDGEIIEDKKDEL
tara:strand:- start:10775 stop:11191 length:417 start_codon:yes stop_codon:yes gene_type:complete